MCSGARCHHREVTWRPLPNPDGDAPTPVGKVVDRVLHSLGGPSVDVLSMVFTGWEDIVGTAIASVSEPLSLDRGVLVVAVPDGGWASQLRWMETDLVAKVNERVGSGTVTHLEARVRPR